MTEKLTGNPDRGSASPSSVPLRVRVSRHAILRRIALLLILDVLLIGLPWIQPASAVVAPNGRLFYGDVTNAGVLKFQTNTYDFTFSSEVSTGISTTSSNIAHVVAKIAPTRDEVIVGHLKVDGRLDIIKGVNGYDVNTDYAAAWSNAGATGSQTCNSTSEVDCTRAFDISYERLSGRAMVVYADTTNQKLYYCYWDGSAWGPVSDCAPTNGTNDISLTSNGRPTFVSLKAKGGTNEILLGVSIDVSGTHEVEAFRWDGSSWGNSVVATDSTNASTLGLESGQIMDVEWESLSGDGMVVWGSSAGNGATKYKLFTGGSWGSEQTGPASPGGNGTMATMNLDADPVSNRIAYTYTDSTNDSAPGIWKADGSTAGWSMGNEDGGLENADVGTQYADIIWQKSGSVAMWVAHTGGTSVDTEYQTATCTGSGCTFSSIDATMATAGADDGTFIRLAQSPNSNDIMTLWGTHDRDLYAQHWFPSAWESGASASREADLSPGTADNTQFHGLPAAFAYIPYSSWQRNWRFYTDTTSNDPSTGLAAENTAGTINAEDFTRLRVNVAELSGQAQTDARKKLQYASGCNPNTSETACTWNDVGDTGETTAVWRYATQGETCLLCIDGTAVVTNRLTGSSQLGWYNSDKDAAAAITMDHNSLAIVELDFPLKAESVSGGTTYYFRLYDVDQDRAVRREQDNDGSNDCASATCTYPSVAIASTGSLSVDIVDSGGSSVSSPSMVMSAIAVSFTSQTATGTFGTSSEKVRVTNTTGTATWTLSIAATSGATALWDSAGTDYDFNDPTAGAGDGGDADSVGGQLTLNASAGTVTPQSGCSTTGITKGSSTGFSQGVTDSITLLTAGSTADTNCYWDLTGISISQTIPREQPAASDYDINMTVTVAAS